MSRISSMGDTVRSSENCPKVVPGSRGLFNITSLRRFRKEVGASVQSTSMPQRFTFRSFGTIVPSPPNRAGHSVDCRGMSEMKDVVSLVKEIDSSAGSWELPMPEGIPGLDPRCSTEHRSTSSGSQNHEVPQSLPEENPPAESNSPSRARTKWGNRDLPRHL